ncbi:putative mitochondrial protein [Vitis vinifera]|uniref:Putative mitochondrial protein n=1 Tax=Vitis vinifera TaxID=29760 RepID=A0A438CSP0_VITVI|nr:putative mitochondrial protein [Vitis vinifera]
MSGCLSTVSYAILVNGNAKGWVKASRGLRQGDPLSPFLFTLVADVLSRMLLRPEERNSLKSFRNHLSRLAELLDCKASGWPILYLGLPLGGNPKACGFWDPVIERISRRLNGWQKAYLSFGDGYIVVLEGYCTSLSGIFQVYSVCGRRWGKNSILRDLWYSTRPFSWNFNFRYNLFDSEVEDLRRPHAVTDDLHLSPSGFRCEI